MSPSPIKLTACPNCGADSLKTGLTPLPDGNSAYEQYCCLRCGHGFLIGPIETEIEAQKEVLAA